MIVTHRISVASVCGNAFFGGKFVEDFSVNKALEMPTPRPGALMRTIAVVVSPRVICAKSPLDSASMEGKPSDLPGR
jgi:hypothetical protein